MPSSPAILCTLGAALLSGVVAVAACDDAAAGPPPVFSLDELAGWSEARDCRFSHEHELRYIRVLCSPEAEGPYATLTPDRPYPVGARLVKIEYDEADCATPLGYTAMEKLPPGASPAGGDWLWQDLDARLRVIDQGPIFQCVNCHTHHCAPPLGYDLSCAEEL